MVAPDPITRLNAALEGRYRSSPAWSPDGRQVYFLANGMLMVTDVLPGDEFRVGEAVQLIDPLA